MQKELVHDNKAVMQKTALSRETYLLWEGYGAVVNQLWVRLSLKFEIFFYVLQQATAQAVPSPSFCI